MPRKNINARRKSQKSKKPKPLPAKLRKVRADINHLFGMPAKTVRAAKKVKAALDRFESDDPRSDNHLTVCVYAGNAPKGALPIEPIKWTDAVIKYAISKQAATPMRVGLVLGNSVAYASNIAGLVTFFPLLKTGRAADDMRMAMLLWTKAMGVLN